MSETTIEIPVDQVEAIRRSLLGRRGEADRPQEVDELLAQIAGGAPGDAGARVLTGPRTVIWSAVYDSLCVAAERLADDCNEYWRGAMAPESVRATLGDVGARLELLTALGAPPAG